MRQRKLEVKPQPQHSSFVQFLVGWLPPRYLPIVLYLPTYVCVCLKLHINMLDTLSIKYITIKKLPYISRQRQEQKNSTVTAQFLFQIVRACVADINNTTELTVTQLRILRNILCIYFSRCLYRASFLRNEIYFYHKN